MTELLLELQMEEVPARMQIGAEEWFKALLESQFKELDLNFESIQIYSTPRRLAALVKGLPTQQKDQVIERKGPQTDAPQQALDGFFKSIGLNPDQCEKLETPKGIFWFAKIQKVGSPTIELIPQVLEYVLQNFKWAKSMRWGGKPFKWVRPLESILAIFDGKNLNGEILSIPLCDSTMGHRFLGEKRSEKLSSFNEYEAFLNKNYVIFDRQKRKNFIKEQLVSYAKKHNLLLNEDEGLLDEVTGLNEYPTLVMANIEPEFMTLPKELLVSVVKTHQRYFTFESKDETLAPVCGVMANNLPLAGDSTMVKRGNENVLRARLSDGKFYWDLDLKTPTKTMADKLKNITFHQKIGTMASKASRVEKIAKLLNAHFKLNEASVLEAASLCKADLTSGVVGEFPELQGIMGGYYSIHEKKSQEMASAIKQHYKPQGPKDSLPENKLGVLLALADKLDTLVGFFAIDERPTGSKDPFALRRAALGIIRLISNSSFDISLGDLLKEIIAIVQQDISSPLSKCLFDQLIEFMAERLKVSLKDQGYFYDVVNAILCDVSDLNIIQIHDKLDAIAKIMNTEVGTNVCYIYTRISRILSSVKETYEVKIDEDLFVEQNEKYLYSAYKKINIHDLLKDKHYTEAMESASTLKDYVDAFFDTITVMAEDEKVKFNRLSLLQMIRNTLKSIADFEQIKVN